MLSHGETRGRSMTREYRAWSAMLRRCNNPNYAHYAMYGGRGVRVAREWLSYEQFLADMGRCPSKHSLDRVDVDGPYSASNCRWTLHVTQVRNRRTYKVRDLPKGVYRNHAGWFVASVAINSRNIHLGTAMSAGAALRLRLAGEIAHYRGYVPRDRGDFELIKPAMCGGACGL